MYYLPAHSSIAELHSQERNADTWHDDVERRTLGEAAAYRVDGALQKLRRAVPSVARAAAAAALRRARHSEPALHTNELLFDVTVPRVRDAATSSAAAAKPKKNKRK